MTFQQGEEIIALLKKLVALLDGGVRVWHESDDS